MRLTGAQSDSPTTQLDTINLSTQSTESKTDSGRSVSCAYNPQTTMAKAVPQLDFDNSGRIHNSLPFPLPPKENLVTPTSQKHDFPVKTPFIQSKEQGPSANNPDSAVFCRGGGSYEIKRSRDSKLCDEKHEAFAPGQLNSRFAKKIKGEGIYVSPRSDTAHYYATEMPYNKDEPKVITEITVTNKANIKTIPDGTSHPNLGRAIIKKPKNISSFSVLDVKQLTKVSLEVTRQDLERHSELGYKLASEVPDPRAQKIWKSFTADVYETEGSKPERMRVWVKCCELSPAKKSIRPSSNMREYKYSVWKDGQYIRIKPKASKSPEGNTDITKQYIQYVRRD